MARHAIYVKPEAEQLIAELRLDQAGYSALFTRALTSLLSEMPPAKVQRAARRVARNRGAAELEHLMPANGE